MRPFTLFKIWKNKDINDFDIEQFDSIEQARTHAELMIRNHGYDAVEIFFDDRTLIVNKDDGQLS